jgi:hypothetical protein
MSVHHLVRNNAIINTPLGKANCFAETLEQIHQVPDHPHFDDVFFASTTSCYRSPPDEDQTVRRRHRRVDKPEKPSIAARILQGYLDDITTWTNTWRIKPNPLKSQSILMSYSGANNSRSRHQAPHFLLNNQAIPKLQHIRYLGVTFSKNCTLNQDVKETLKKNPQPSQPSVQDSRAHPWVRSENPVPHLQNLHPSRHRIPCPHLRHPIPCPSSTNLRLREKNAPQDLSTLRQVSLRQPPPRNQHNPNPIPLQRTPKPLRDPHLKLQKRPRHPNPFHILQIPVTRRPPPQQNPENSQAQAPPPNSSPLTSLHRTTGRPPGACGLDSLDHAVTVEDDETLGTQDIYTGKPF